MVEDAEYEIGRMDNCDGYLRNYLRFDREAFVRDLQYDIEGLVSPYDGTVHEMRWTERPVAGGSLVTRRGTLYMIRED